MESRANRIESKLNSNVVIRTIPGHFATNHSHINNYVDMTIMKCRKSEAAAAASVLARKYTNNTYIDTIICMDGCEVIGAYLADDLTESGIMSLNRHQTMYVVTPEMNSGGQLIFRDNMEMMIKGKHCILLLASATTGRTIASAIECSHYYGVILERISAIFSASSEVEGYEINSIFHGEDIGDYQTYEVGHCPMCAAGQKIDALVNSFGYSKL